MFNTNYKIKLEKLKNKKTIEKDLFQKMLNEHKKDGNVSEKADIKINNIINNYDLLINEIEETLNLKTEDEINKDVFNNYKLKFKQIVEN